MILNQQTNDVLVFGEDTSKKAKISEDKLAKLQYLLTKGLYKDPISAVIVEWTNNGVDGIVQAGKSPVDNPVIVSINKEGNKYKFTVKDNGVGLDKNDFENVCMNYLESTKENDNNTIGHFGLGMKSFLALERPATFTCIKNGWKRKYIVYEGQEFVNYELILEEETKEEDGVECQLDIIDWTERNHFLTKAKQRLAYYDTAVLIEDNNIVDNNIVRTDIFQWSTLNMYDEIHICLKDVVYKIDWDALDIKAIKLPIALRFGLDSGLKPTPSRESYITNQLTKDLIINKLKDLSNYMIQKYNDGVPDESTFLEAYNSIGEDNKYLKIEDKNFLLNVLFKFASIPVKQTKITKIDNPEHFKGNIARLNNMFTKVSMLETHGSWKNKRIYYNMFDYLLSGNRFADSGKVVLVDTLPIGNIKSFLIEKYKRTVLFVTKNDMKLSNYIDVFNLRKGNKHNWRTTIQNWQYVQSLFEEKMIVESNIADKQEYLDFIDKRKAAAKQYRRDNPFVSKPLKSLNKQDGDITLGISSMGLGTRVVFEKKAYSISSLSKIKMYVVYGTEEQKDMLEKLYKTFDKNRYKNNSLMKTCIIGKREITKLPKLHNFITMEKFLSEGNKKFRQLATAQLVKDTLLAYTKLEENLLYNKYLVSLEDDIKVLKEYLVKHSINLGQSVDIKQAIMTLAKEQNLWDYSIYHVIKKVQDSNDVLAFAKHLAVPKAYDTDDIKAEFSRIVNHFILFNKVHKNKLEGFELVQTIPQPIDEKKSDTLSEEDELLENEVESILKYQID